MSPNQQSDSSSDSRCLHDAVAQLPTPSVDLEKLVTNSRGTVTPWNYAAETTDITTTANQRMTAGGGNAGLMTDGASAGLPVSTQSSSFCMFKGKGLFLYSVVSSPRDCSKRFTLHPLADLFISTPSRLLWEAFSHAAITT